MMSASQTHGMITARKAAAAANGERVRVTLAAMRRRGTPANTITVQAVAAEAGISTATLYRRTDLFAMIHRVNPALQRRVVEQQYHNEIERLQRAHEMDQQEIRYQQQAVQLAKSGTQRLIADNRLLRKQKLDLEGEVTRLKIQHQHCLCRCSDTLPRNKS